MKSSWLVILTTLENFFYMQISVAIIEITILFNNVKNSHGTVKQMVYIPIFSRSMVRINTIRKVLFSHRHYCKTSFFNICERMHDNKIPIASTCTLSWSGIMIDIM